jgi:hypothetical protein
MYSGMEPEYMSVVSMYLSAITVLPPLKGSRHSCERAPYAGYNLYLIIFKLIPVILNGIRRKRRKYSSAMMTDDDKEERKKHGISDCSDYAAAPNISY